MKSSDGKSGIQVYYCGNGKHGRELPNALFQFTKSGVMVEPVPCAGKIDPRYVLKAFEAGATAVCVLACPFGHCKTLEGNLRAFRRVELAKEMLGEAGIDPAAAQIYVPLSAEQDTLDAAVNMVAEFVKKYTRKAEEALV